MVRYAMVVGFVSYLRICRVTLDYGDKGIVKKECKRVYTKSRLPLLSIKIFLQ